MKKFFSSIHLSVCVIIFVLIIIDIICIFEYDFSTNKGNEVFKLVFQGSISGMVTLGGLLFTYFRQEQVNRCPCIIFQQEGNASARQPYRNIEKSNCIDCCDNNTEYARKIKIHIYNTKEAWAINCVIINTQIGAVKGSEYLCKYMILHDCGNNDSTKIKIKFQDVYGKRYAQTIICNRCNTEYIFTSSLPK